MTTPNKVGPDEIRALTVDQVNAYLQRKDCERPCEACGHGDWIIDSWKGQIVFFSSGLAYLNQAFMITLPLTCEFCGHVRHYNATRVAKDIKDWEAQNGED